MCIQNPVLFHCYIILMSENGGQQNPADNGVQVTVRNNPGPAGKVDERQKHVYINPGRRRKKVSLIKINVDALYNQATILVGAVVAVIVW